jgi:hypothetical protein
MADDAARVAPERTSGKPDVPASGITIPSHYVFMQKMDKYTAYLCI